MINILDKKALENRFAENFASPLFPVLADIYLSEGSHECVMEYYENGGGANASLYWTPPGGIEALVLQSDSDPIEDYDIIFQTKLTDSEGKVNFSWNEYQEGDLYITITKRNYRPYEGIIEIDAIDGYAIAPDYEILSNYIDDSNAKNDWNWKPQYNFDLAFNKYIKPELMNSNNE